MTNELTTILPRYNQTSVKMFDYIRHNPGCSFNDIVSKVGDDHKTNAQLRGYLVTLLRENMVFADHVGREPAEYFLTIKAENALDKHDIKYAS